MSLMQTYLLVIIHRASGNDGVCSKRSEYFWAVTVLRSGALDGKSTDKHLKGLVYPKMNFF